MDLPELGTLLNSPLAVGLIGVVVGALLASVLSAYRNRLQVLEYWVHHERVAFAAEDAVFGNVQVTWQGTDVRNLFVTTVTVANNSSKDYSDLQLRVYTGETLLLTERGEIADTTYLPKWTQSFQDRLHVAEGERPTDQQQNVYWHSREYLLPVLNRGQRAVFTYLTSVPQGDSPPLAWADLLHKGTQLVFREPVQEIHGVPIRLALPLGLLLCLLVLVTSALYIEPPWTVGLLSMLAGLFAQSLGAGLYRVARFARHKILP